MEFNPEDSSQVIAGQVRPRRGLAFPVDFQIFKEPDQEGFDSPSAEQIAPNMFIYTVNVFPAQEKG